MITFQYFKIAYDDKGYVSNLADKWLETVALEIRRHQESQRHPNIPVQEEEWPNDPGYQDLINIPNAAPTNIIDPVTREYPPREFVSSVPDTKETAPRDTESREPEVPVHQKRSRR